MWYNNWLTHVDCLIPLADVVVQPLSALLVRKRNLADTTTSSATSDSHLLASALLKQQKPVPLSEAAASVGSTSSSAASPSHGTSAGFCAICKKFVSNRTNHKYVHSQVRHRFAVAFAYFVCAVPDGFP
jgi:hypothetical protein